MKSRSYRMHIASLPCLLCGGNEVHAHHLLRTGEHGMGKKSGDEWCVPLCANHHDQLHRRGDEVVFFGIHDLDYAVVKRWCINTYRSWVKIHGEPKDPVKRKAIKEATRNMRVPIRFYYAVEHFIRDQIRKENDAIN